MARGQQTSRRRPLLDSNVSLSPTVHHPVQAQHRIHPHSPALSTQESNHLQRTRGREGVNQPHSRRRSMAAPPSSPVKQPVRADADPLVQSEPFASSSSPTPISFKRRTPSRSLGIRTGLLGGILSRSNEDDVDKVPSMPFVREDAPKKIAMPPSPYGSRDSNVLYSDEEELDDGQRTPTGTERMLGHGLNQQRMLGQGGKGPGRISFGAEVGRPPRRGDPYSPSIGSGSASLSPGGRRDGASDFEGEKPYSTPLPTIPMLVLCIAMFGEFLCASTSSPFLYFMIEDFGVGKGKDGGGEAAVGFWTGIVGFVQSLSGLPA
jgi:hypothetical protein